MRSAYQCYTTGKGVPHSWYTHKENGLFSTADGCFFSSNACKKIALQSIAPSAPLVKKRLNSLKLTLRTLHRNSISSFKQQATALNSPRANFLRTLLLTSEVILQFTLTCVSPVIFPKYINFNSIVLEFYLF